MAEEPPKPFACTSEGCTMTFSNQDHLIVHQRKHEMVLHFGIKNSGLIADQTPTPTRFLQNCDEVGLFQDLQNVNPFDEPFRKAAEMVKSGSLPVPSLPDDDTLHTPHIFPHLPQVTIIKQKIESKLATTDKSITVISNNKTPPIITIEDVAQSKETSDETEQDEPAKIPRAKYRRYSHMLNDKHSTTLASANSAKSKLQQLLLCKEIKPKPPPSFMVVPMLQTGPPILPKIEFFDCSKKQIPRLKPTRPINMDATKDPAKLDNRARNRLAALRSRTKKRIFIDTLEEKLSNVNRENYVLKGIIANLNKEVSRLNTQLNAHQNCPVTLALKNGESIPIQINLVNDEMEIVIEEKMSLKEKGEFSASPQESDCIIDDDNSILS